jgi:hypothetical protein
MTKRTRPSCRSVVFAVFIYSSTAFAAPTDVIVSSETATRLEGMFPTVGFQKAFEQKPLPVISLNIPRGRPIELVCSWLYEYVCRKFNRLECRWLRFQPIYSTGDNQENYRAGAGGRCFYRDTMVASNKETATSSR